MIDWMKNLYRPPSPQAMALRELESAKREKLDAESVWTMQSPLWTTTMLVLSALKTFFMERQNELEHL